jgi:hypothetical protein
MTLPIIPDPLGLSELRVLTDRLGDEKSMSLTKTALAAAEQDDEHGYCQAIRQLRRHLHTTPAGRGTWHMWGSRHHFDAPSNVVQGPW